MFSVSSVPEGLNESAYLRISHLSIERITNIVPSIEFAVIKEAALSFFQGYVRVYC